MFTPDSMRGPSLDDRRIFRPTPRTEGCKVFLQVANVNCPTDETGLSLYLTQRTRRTQNYKANYATAEVVAGYARQRPQRQIVDEDGKLSHTKRQSADTAISGVPADCLYCAKKKALGLKSSPSHSCCRTSLPRWYRSASRC